MFKLILKKFLKLSILALLVLSFLVLGNLYTYKRLTAENPIAHLEFTPVGNQVFDASLRIGDFCEVNTYRIYGDEWRIDSQFLKWKSWANLLGLDAMYRIDRISGRYIDINDENSKLHSAHDLKIESTLDLSMIAERYENKFPPVDTVYGSSVYEKMHDDILFTVYQTQSGLLIRENKLPDPGNKISCLSDDSKLKSTILMLDKKLVSIIKSFNI